MPRPQCGRIELPWLSPLPDMHCQAVSGYWWRSPVDILSHPSRNISLLLANKRGPTITKLFEPLRPPGRPSKGLLPDAMIPNTPCPCSSPNLGDHGFSFISQGSASTIPSLFLYQGKFLTSVVCVASPPLSFMIPPRRTPT